MAKDPAVLWYPNDWLGGTIGMTFEEKGAYFELLMMQFNRGHMTEHMIGQVVGQLWDKVRSKFDVDENGLYYNARFEQETNKRKAYVESRKNNRSGKNQHSDTSAHMTNHMTNHMENENEDINRDVNDTKDRGSGGKEFDAFWSAYPKKVGKEAARKAFAKVPKSAYPDLVPAVENQRQSEQWRKNGGQYIPNPATWLNQGRWQDELDKPMPKPKAPTNKDYEQMNRLRERVASNAD